MLAPIELSAATNYNEEERFNDLDEFGDFGDFSGSSQPINDPLEKFNRKVHGFNEVVDRYFFEHVARFYRKGMPKRVRISIRNFLTNLSMPMSMVNSLAQGKGENSLASLSSFLINSSVGVFGIFDVAGERNFRVNKEDFGQTLGYYGFDSGPYLVIPFLGPSSVRDFFGYSIDKSIDPFNGNLFEVGGSSDFVNPELLIGLNVIGAVDQREALLDIISDVRKDSFDPYATMRSAYLQKRSNQISN